MASAAQVTNQPSITTTLAAFHQQMQYAPTYHSGFHHFAPGVSNGPPVPPPPMPQIPPAMLNCGLSSFAPLPPMFTFSGLWQTSANPGFPRMHFFPVPSPIPSVESKSEGKQKLRTKLQQRIAEKAVAVLPATSSEAPMCPTEYLNPLTLALKQSAENEKSMAKFVAAAQLKSQHDSDSGNESGPHESPQKTNGVDEKLSVSQQNRESSTSPKSDGTHHSSSSSGYKSPKSSHSLLVSLLRTGDDFGASASAPHSPTLSSGSAKSAAEDYDLHDVDASSDGSRKTPGEHKLITDIRTAVPAQGLYPFPIPSTSAGPSFSGAAFPFLPSTGSSVEDQRTRTPPYLVPNFNSFHPFLNGFPAGPLYPQPSAAYFSPQLQQNGPAAPTSMPLSVNSAFVRAEKRPLDGTSDSYHGSSRKSPRMDNSIKNALLKLDTSAGPAAIPKDSLSSGGSISDASPRSAASESRSSGSPSCAFPLLHNAKCAICDDRASGFHYGVVSCEGCKGFFRRSVQKEVTYSCHKNGECMVTRVTRNRCQACRFNKCMQMGMTKESVRQDKNRRRRIRDEERDEADLRATANIQSIIQQVVQAHNLSAYPVQLDKPVEDVTNFIREELVGNDNGGIRRVIQFCEKLPGYEQISESDRNSLLRQAVPEILILRCAFLFCGHNGLANENSPNQPAIDGLMRLRNSLRQLQIFGEEIALLSAVCFMNPTRYSLEDIPLIDRLQENLLEALRVQIHIRSLELRDSMNRQAHNVFARLVMKLSDLRLLSVYGLETLMIPGGIEKTIGSQTTVNGH